VTYRVRYTEPAKRDLREITIYLRKNAGDPIAKRISDELIAKAESLAIRPARQRERRNLGTNICSVTMRSYRIFYRVLAEETVFILRILHGSRDITSKLFPQSDDV
jgi:addiction module RelE/StbE family toxin